MTEGPFATVSMVCYNFPMLDLNFVRNNLELVKEKVAAKGVAFSDKDFLEIDQTRRKAITQMETLKSEKNKLGKEIGQLRRNKQDSSELEARSVALSKEIDELETGVKDLDDKFSQMMLNIPNLYDDSVPIGASAEDNVVVREWGEKPEFGFEPKPHWELGEKNQVLDFPRATKIAGARFALYLGGLAKLERSLINLMLDKHTQEGGYLEALPPFLANDQSLIGTGNLPKFKDDLFKIEGYNFYLIPTAEVPLTNIHRDETLNEENLPMKYVAYTPCFRSEAGSYGKDIRGIIRQHQFNKVELLQFTSQETSFELLEELTRSAESILQALNIHYRVVVLCSGDMSFSSAKTYDIEVWMPARNGYVEISSCSNFTDFQARRSKIKYKGKDGKKHFAHTLNGSGLAVGRTVAAIMENYQTEDGKIRVPEGLKGFFSNQDYI